MAALVSGAQAAENVAVTMQGKSPQPLSFIWYEQGNALGPKDAVRLATHLDVQARSLIFRRKLAMRVRNFFAWYLITALELEWRFPGCFYWHGKGRYAQQKRLQ